MLSASWRIEMWQENSRGTLDTLDVCLLGNNDDHDDNK